MVYAKTAQPIKMPFGGLTHMGQRKHVLDGGQGRTNSFAAVRGDKKERCCFSFRQNFFDHLLLSEAVTTFVC